MGAMATGSVLSLALITGCGGGSDDQDASGESGKSSSSSATAAKAVGAAELEKLLLAQGDVKGYKVDSGDDTLPKSKSGVTTDKAECAPLAHAMAGLAPGDTNEGASNSVTEVPVSDAASKSPEDISEADIENAFKVKVTFVGLSSYDDDGAEKALKAVTDGIESCSGGFVLTGQGEKQKITKVAAGKSSGAGDESVAFSADSDMDGAGSATFNTEVVRVGNTVATYYTVDFATLGKAAAVPTAVIEAQTDKLK
ncbi:lipoprotein [Streptomyces viridiviolaceus]|nr:lipoprotein [Streptomyces viridiviolaceus]